MYTYLNCTGPIAAQGAVNTNCSAEGRSLQATCSAGTPTYKPTPLPTPQAGSPTNAPTKAVITALAVIQTISGVSIATAKTASFKKSFATGVAATLNIFSNYVNVTGAAEKTSRRYDMRQLLDTGVSVSYTVTIPNADATALQAQITTASSSGQLTTSLVNAGLVGVSASSAPVVSNISPTSSPTPIVSSFSPTRSPTQPSTTRPASNSVSHPLYSYLVYCSQSSTTTTLYFYSKLRVLM